MTTIDPNALSKDVVEAIDELRQRYPSEAQQSVLLGALHVIQDHYGYIKEEHMATLAEQLQIPEVAVHEAVSFYTMYRTQPVGRHTISVCNHVACLLSGAQVLIDSLEKSLGIKPGETTEDDRITWLEEEECLAGCSRGPIVIIDGQYHEYMTVEKLSEVLEGLE